MLSRRKTLHPFFSSALISFLLCYSVGQRSRSKWLYCRHHCESGWESLLDCLNYSISITFRIMLILFLQRFPCPSSEDLRITGRRLNGSVLSPHLCYSSASFHSSLIHMHIQCAVDNQRFWADNIPRSVGRCCLLPLCRFLTAAWWKWG